MYWNLLSRSYLSSCTMINRNMRCIEMSETEWSDWYCMRLIETWDVLKYVRGFSTDGAPTRLIETWDVLKCLLAGGLTWEDKD